MTPPFLLFDQIIVRLSRFTVLSPAPESYGYGDPCFNYLPIPISHFLTVSPARSTDSRFGSRWL